MICDCEFFIGSCDWGLSIEWGGGVNGAWGRGGIFELGEVNAHGVCASVTNKQYFNQPIINWGKQLINNN